jgi:hypothetical protein
LPSSATTGVVNVYDTSDIASQTGYDQDIGLLPITPKPMRELMNLTTSVSTLAFNHDAQIMAIGSDKKKDAFRMVSIVLSIAVNSRSPFYYLRSICPPLLRSRTGRHRRHHLAQLQRQTFPQVVNMWLLAIPKERSCCMDLNIIEERSATKRVVFLRRFDCNDT